MAAGSCHRGVQRSMDHGAAVLLIGTPVFWTLRNRAASRTLGTFVRPSEREEASLDRGVRSELWTPGTKQKTIKLAFDEALTLLSLLDEFWKRNQPPVTREDYAELERIEVIRGRVIDAHAKAVDGGSDEIMLWVNEAEGRMLQPLLSLTLSMNQPPNPLSRDML